MEGNAVMAGATTLGELASAIGVGTGESAMIAELKAGSEEAYSRLIGEFQQPIYGLIYRMMNDPSDAADTTQEVFLKVFRGMKHFHGESTLKTWIYRIALHEAANRRRWWFRHKAQERPIELGGTDGTEFSWDDRLAGRGESPLEEFAHTEVREAVEKALHEVAEPYRTALILRDLEDMSYEQIAEVLAISLGTVKSRITRGRDALRKKLTEYARAVGPELGLLAPRRVAERAAGEVSGRVMVRELRKSASLSSSQPGSGGGREAEVRQ
ncbi:MAG: sigma-70 family RNA polymerase sigma factor [Terriglobales bacterium]